MFLLHPAAHCISREAGPEWRVVTLAGTELRPRAPGSQSGVAGFLQPHRMPLVVAEKQPGLFVRSERRQMPCVEGFP